MSNTLDKQLKATLVKIYVSGDFQGTGFFITPHGHILTAHHVLDDHAGKDIDVVSEKHGKFTKVPIFNKECRGHDLIVLKINFDKEQIKLDCVPLSQQLPEDRAEVLGAGFPLANEDPERMKAAIYDGRFIRSYSDSKTFEVGNAIQGKGQSGGLIYDVKSQRVIGVVRQVHETNKNTGLATRLDGLFETWEELANITKQVANNWDIYLSINSLSNSLFSNVSCWFMRAPLLCIIYLLLSYLSLTWNDLDLSKREWNESLLVSSIMLYSASIPNVCRYNILLIAVLIPLSITIIYLLLLIYFNKYIFILSLITLIFSFTVGLFLTTLSPILADKYD